MTHLLPLHFRGLVATGVLGLTGNIGLAALSTPCLCCWATRAKNRQTKEG